MPSSTTMNNAKVNQIDAEPIARRAVVDSELAGLRFDQAAAKVFSDFSRERLKAWINEGALLLDGEAVKPRDVVSEGQVLSLTAEAQPLGHAAAEDIPLNFLYQDKAVLVVNKPPGLVVHLGAGVHSGTLENALLHFDPKLKLVPRAGIVHRLDKDTSGALLIARTLNAHTKLVAALQAREFHRQYECVVTGNLIAGGTIEAPIDRHPTDRVKMAVREGGRDSVTHYRLIERFKHHTHVRCFLETGRTHQIRVHMAHMRMPILGDPVYGGGLKLPKAASPALTECLRTFRRQALHAEKLEFAHPTTGKAISCDAERPADFSALLELLRRETPA
jgi:23S rRNA pseudouridine1911/1915/1917 synthase